MIAQDITSRDREIVELEASFAGSSKSKDVGKLEELSNLNSLRGSLKIRVGHRIEKTFLWNVVLPI
ncbi:hypothetical protein G4B88_030935 [Cannabis sativa]|uniref:Uncharacterized protein n=1 Tax=Cannabis sativa TaxID=3483 RepID=A0A7J6EAZ5_CANSA|nr:hypothetical protein G4B88_030935 [Cannabis sativa]